MVRLMASTTKDEIVKIKMFKNIGIATVTLSVHGDELSAKDNFDIDENEIDNIEARLDMYASFSAKYGKTEGDMLDYLANAKVDIRALSIADTTDFGILRLIVDKPDVREDFVFDRVNGLKII